MNQHKKPARTLAHAGQTRPSRPRARSHLPNTSIQFRDSEHAAKTLRPLEDTRQYYTPAFMNPTTSASQTARRRPGGAHRRPPPTPAAQAASPPSSILTWPAPATIFVLLRQALRRDLAAIFKYTLPNTPHRSALADARTLDLRAADRRTAPKPLRRLPSIPA